MNVLQACHSFAARTLGAFHRDRSAATLTEFVITLPIWIIMMGGLINFGKLGQNTTGQKMEAQRIVWNEVFAASTGKKQAHMFPVEAGGTASATSFALAGTGGNPHKVADGANGLVMSTGLAVDGSWGESYERVLPLKVVPGADVPDVYYDPDDVLDGGSPYPHKIVYDGAANSDWKTGNGLYSTIIGFAGNALSGSGALAALGAGDRYGEVYAHPPDQKISLIFGQQVTAHAHANLLVAPSPLKGKEARFGPFILARLVAEGEKNYSVMMNFGKSEWKNSGGYKRDTPGSPSDQINGQKGDKVDKEKKKRKKCQGDNPPSWCTSYCAKYKNGC